MKTFPMLMIAATITATVPAWAQQLDLATVRCKEFTDSTKENTGLIVMWLQGYYSEESAPPVVDFDKMKSHSAKIAEYCRRFPGHSVITAAEKVMGQ
jgi:acid stress chaperone HdeB